MEPEAIANDPGGPATLPEGAGVVNLPLWTPERRYKALMEAESWHGTRHANRIAVRRVGIDCIQLVYRIYVAAGLLPDRRLFVNYDVDAGLYERSDLMERILMEVLNAESLSATNPQFGDIVLFQTGARSAHCGFYVEDHVWHSLANQCVICSQWSLWKHRAEKLIRLSGEGFRADPRESVKRHGR